MIYWYVSTGQRWICMMSLICSAFSRHFPNCQDASQLNEPVCVSFEIASDPNNDGGHQNCCVGCDERRWSKQKPPHNYNPSSERSNHSSHRNRQVERETSFLIKRTCIYWFWLLYPFEIQGLLWRVTLKATSSFIMKNSSSSLGTPTSTWMPLFPFPFPKSVHRPVLRSTTQRENH